MTRAEMLMGQFLNGGVTLHIPDGDAQNDAKAVHDEALQPVDLWLQQHSAFCTITEVKTPSFESLSSSGTRGCD